MPKHLRYDRDAVRYEALRIVQDEHITSASMIARRLDILPRAVQRWFHREEFKRALRDAASSPCPHCNGTGVVEPVVYFMRLPDDTIKIGCTYHGLRQGRNTGYSRDRIAGGAGSLLGMESGGFWREAEIHQQFAFCKIGREIFSPSPLLLAYIEALPVLSFQV